MSHTGPSALTSRHGSPFLLRYPVIMLGGGILLAIVVFALIGPLVWTVDPYSQDLGARMVPPVWDTRGSWLHPLGTDHLGRDYLSRLAYGGRISLLVGTAAMALSGAIGTLLGVTAGYFGGRIDAIIMYVITVRLSLPALLVALAVVALAGGSVTVIVLTLGFMLWHRFAVVMRTATMQIRSLDYVNSAYVLGSSTFRIVTSEILPNLLGPFIVIATLEVAGAILIESALSFLGVGVPSPIPSWGLMIAEGKSQLFFRPWLVAIPGTVLFLLVLAINLLGDGLRDATAPDAQV